MKRAVGMVCGLLVPLSLTLASAHAADSNEALCFGKADERTIVASVEARIAACTALLPATEEGPPRGAVLWVRGMLYGVAGKHEGAVTDLTDALKFDLGPSLGAAAHDARSLSHSRLGNDDMALNDANAAVELAPSQAKYWRNRGQLLAKRGEAKIAMRDYGEAIRLDPNDAVAYAARGDLLWAKSSAGWDLDEYERATADYTQAIRIKPDFGDAYSGRCNARLNKPMNLHGAIDPLALPDCDEGIRLAPTAGHYWGRAVLYIKLSRYSDAIADCNAGLKMIAGFAPLIYARGLAKEGNGDKAGGKADMDAALKLDPKVAREFETLNVYPASRFELKPGLMSEQRKEMLKKPCEMGMASEKECKEAGWSK